MNTYSHMILGRLLYEYVKENHGIILEKGSFLRGNVAPDYNVSIITRPHYIENRLGFVKSEIEALADTSLPSEKVGKIYSKRLGVICHYYSDFFCYAHNGPEYRRNMAFHMKYERCLHQYLVDIKDMIKNVKLMPENRFAPDQRAINLGFEALHSEYLRSEPSFDRDIIYALYACAGAVVSLVNCSCGRGLSEALSSYQALGATAG